MQAGAKVTIYTRDLLPDTRSSRATGSWTPDFAYRAHQRRRARFAAQWEEMARISVQDLSPLSRPAGQSGRMGRPLLSVSDLMPAEVAALPGAPDTAGLAEYRDRIGDLVPGWRNLPPEATPFPARTVRRTSTIMFNISRLTATR